MPPVLSRLAALSQSSGPGNKAHATRGLGSRAAEGLRPCCCAWPPWA